MNKKDRLFLEKLAAGPGEPPSGVAAIGISRLLDAGWIKPHPKATLPRFYEITEAGEDALAKDDGRPASR